jgi:hypothetical protein
MGDANYAPVCGLYCGTCDFLGEQCRGCGYMDGKPFWTEQGPWEVCPLHDCCRNHKQLEHCGLCEDFPCKSFLQLRDPNASDEEFRKSLDEKQKSLKGRAEIGTQRWLQEMSAC